MNSNTRKALQDKGLKDCITCKGSYMSCLGKKCIKKETNKNNNLITNEWNDKMQAINAITENVSLIMLRKPFQDLLDNHYKSRNCVSHGKWVFETLFDVTAEISSKDKIDLKIDDALDEEVIKIVFEKMKSSKSYNRRLGKFKLLMKFLFNKLNVDIAWDADAVKLTNIILSGKSAYLHNNQKLFSEFDPKIDHLLARKYILVLHSKNSVTKGPRLIINQFLNYLKSSLGIKNIGEIKVNEITYELLIDYRNYLLELVKRNKISQNTAALKIRIIKNWMTWLARNKYIMKNPSTRVEAIKETKRVKPFKVHFTNEISNYLDAIINNSTHPLRDLAIFELLMSTGIRANEVCQSLISGLNLGDKYLKVMGKGKRERIIPLVPSVTETLKYYILSIPSEFKSENLPLFRNSRGGKLTYKTIYNLHKKYCKYAGIEHKGVHNFRRTIITQLVMQDTDIIDITQLAGWENARYLSRYNLTTTQDLKKIIQKNYQIVK